MTASVDTEMQSVAPVEATSPPSANHSIKNRLIAGVPWVVGGRAVGGGCALLSNMLLARSLTKAEYGIFIFAVAVVFVFMQIATFGLDRSLMRFLSEHSEDSGRDSLWLIRRRCMRIAAFSIGLVVVGGYLVSPLIFKSIDTLVNPSVCVGLVLAGVVGLTLLHLNAESLRGLHDLKFCSVMGAQRTGPQIAVLSLLFISISGLILDQLSVEAALGCFVFSIWLTYISSQYSFLRILRAYYPSENHENEGSKRPPGTKDILKISFALVFLDVLNCFWEVGECFVAGLVISKSELALYGAANQLIFLIVMPTFLALQMIRSSIPILYSQGKRLELQRLLQGCSGAIALVAFVPFLCLFLFSEAILELTYGATYGEASDVLHVLLLGRIGNILIGTSLSVLLFTGRQNVVLYINVLSVAVMLGLASIFAAHWGAYGFAIAAASARTVAYVLYWLCSGRMCGIWAHANVFLAARQVNHRFSVQRA